MSLPNITPWSLIPLWVRALIILLAVSAVVGAVSWGVHSYNESLRQEGRNEVQQEWNAERHRQEAQALAESQTNARETLRRLEAQKEAQDEHDQDLAQAQAAAAAASDAASRLRQRAARLAAGACRTGGNPAARVDSPPADAASGMLADVLGKAVDRSRLLAAYADAARRAGQQCERDYDALRAVTPAH